MVDLRPCTDLTNNVFGLVYAIKRDAATKKYASDARDAGLINRTLTSEAKVNRDKCSKNIYHCGAVRVFHRSFGGHCHDGSLWYWKIFGFSKVFAIRKHVRDECETVKFFGEDFINCGRR